jgi:hypothetical protein
MGTQPRILRNGNKFKTNMTSLEFLKYSKTHEKVEHDASYYKPKRDENGDPVRHFNGSATAVKGLRVSFQDLLKYTDNHFTARLMKITTEVYKRDSEGEHCKKSVYFSRERGLLGNIEFNIRVKNIELFISLIERLHSEDRKEATLIAKDFNLRLSYVPASTTHYRIIHHLCIISDFAFSEFYQCYEPLSKLSGVSAIAYSAYTPLKSVMNEEIKVSLPEGTVLSEDVSVIECFGIEFFMTSGHSFIELMGGGVKVVDIY